jgi:hypothetical protein
MMPLTRLVYASAQYARGEIDEEFYKLALADFTQRLGEPALQRLANQLSKLDPIGM